ncbi:MAG: hypothetical protein RL760_1369 [Candidatus Eisenbacteria bacterium]
MRRSRVALVVARAGLLAATLLLACASCAPRAQTPPRTVTFWVTAPVAAIAPSVRRFEAETPGVVVELVGLPWTTGADTLEAALAADRAPDLAQLHDAQVGPLMGRGLLTDWSAGVADLRTTLRGWDLCMEGDAILGLPWLVRTQSLVLDEALCARAHLDPSRPPATWSELRAAAIALQRLGHGVHGLGIAVDDSGAALASVMPFLWGNGGALANATRDTSWLDSPANREALAYLQSLRPALLTASQDSLEREALAGRLGMLITGAGFEARAAAAPSPRAFVFAGLPAPARDHGTAAAWLGGEVLASFTASRHKEDALKLARFLARPDEDAAVARALAAVQPAALAADTSAWVRASAMRRVIARQLADARALPPHGQWPAMARVLAQAFADVLTARRTPSEALASADTTFAARLRQR